MYSGAQISLYPMTDDFVGVITEALAGLDPYRDRLKIETDDLSTLLIGPPETLFAAMRDLFTAAARTGIHCTMSALISRGCPGGPEEKREQDDPSAPPALPLAERQAEAITAVRQTSTTGVESTAQFALYVMGAGDHMAEINGCVAFLQHSGTFDRTKNFCTKLRGDTGPLFATLEEALCRFGPPAGHVTIDLTVSANSPSAR